MKYNLHNSHSEVNDDDDSGRKNLVSRSKIKLASYLCTILPRIRIAKFGQQKDEINILIVLLVWEIFLLIRPGAGAIHS